MTGLESESSIGVLVVGIASGPDLKRKIFFSIDSATQQLQVQIIYGPLF